MQNLAPTTPPLLPALTAAQVHQFQELDHQIETRLGTVQEVYEAAMKIFEGQLYRAKFATWDDYCRFRFGKTAAAFRQFRRRRLLGSTVAPQDAAGDIARLERRLQTAKNIIEKVSAKQDKTLPVVTLVPVPMPGTEEPPLPAIKMPSDLCLWVKRIRTDMEKLLRESIFAASDRFRHCAALLAKVDQAITPELPLGLPPMQKSRGTKEQVVEFCVNVGLTAIDGEWFFEKAEGCGWKNNGVPIVDWRATVRQWKAQGNIFPSHKAAAPGAMSGAEMMIRQKELDTCEVTLGRIRDRYSSVDRPWSNEDKARFQKAKSRRDELKKLLGIQV